MDSVGGKGKKQCKKCNVFVGVRTKKCSCGYEFANSVPASGQSMSLDPLDQRIKESVGSARSILKKAESRSVKPLLEEEILQNQEEIQEQDQEQDQEKDQIKLEKGDFYSGIRHSVITTPAGQCPIKPHGYKAGWPNGPASDEVIHNWACAVYNFGEGKYGTKAVIYWARYFWEILDSEFYRVRDTIVAALATRKPDDDLELKEDNLP